MILERLRDAARHPEPLRTPVDVAERDLTRLGATRGSAYWTHPKYGELREDPDIYRDDRLPNVPVLRVADAADGSRQYRVFHAVAAGTFARLSAPRQAPKAKPARTVSALRGVWTFRGAPEVMVPGERGRTAAATSADAMAYLVTKQGEGGGAKLLPGKPRATHPADMIARFEAKGIELLAPVVDDVPELIAFAPGGRINDAERDALHRARRLIAGHLSGAPATCEGPECTEPAVDVLWPSELVVCATHTQPESWR